MSEVVVGDTLTHTLLEYATARNEDARRRLASHRLQHVQKLQRIASLGEKQNSDLVDLRNCIEYINQHTNLIQSALRDAGENDAAVPVCSNIVKDIIDVKSNIQESIINSKEIKESLGANYEPLMENLLKKMEIQLNNWTSVLNVASRNLLNSKALIENIQNLIITQQQICSEVAESELFSKNMDVNSTPLMEGSIDDTDIEALNCSSIYCNTSISN